MSTSATAAIPRPESFYQFQAPPLDLTTSVVTKSILLGRQLMLLPFMPLMKSRPEQPLDGEKLKVPLEELEHAFVHHQLLEQGTVYGEDETFPLPRIHIDDVEPAQLQRLIFHTPVIIEGMIDKDMLQRWSLERLKQRFGDAKLWVTNADLTEYKSSMGAMLDDIIAGDETGKYVRSASDVFVEQPELLEQLPFATMKTLMGKVADYFGAELFIGGRGTGTPFHCAPFFNFFAMIHGTKDWLFVHPSYSPWIYPILHHMGYGVSRVRHRNSAEIDEKYPLYRHIPRLSCRLEAGDMLINPPWWWHAVDNLSPSSIGIATRWVEPGLTRFNRTYELVGQLNKGSRELLRNAHQAREGQRLRDWMWRDRFHLKPPAFDKLFKRG
ncbi:MAG: cupin-like domain-containing protein [Myxococcales bacterium]|nr:cupin-like domain-containing protein [Myxococcales bacterium]MCA9700985.1 cupin-like domain-containing protein [Myxococcales bacterium]